MEACLISDHLGGLWAQDVLNDRPVRQAQPRQDLCRALLTPARAQPDS